MELKYNLCRLAAVGLHSSTLATLKHFQDADWFARVGQKFVDSGTITVPVIVVESWEDAIRECQNPEWDLVLNESANIFRRKLPMDDFRKWNDRVREVKLVSEPLVESKLSVIRERHNLPKDVGDTLRWIVLLTLVEAEYAHIVSDGNHAKLSFWIVNGHFPCGWKGEFPNGNLIIF